jgi:phytoene desaturase
MSDLLPNSPHAAVIGSGFGGLAIAIRLLASGFRVTLFEARDKPGGRAYVYENQGYVFDAGPTVITAPHCIEELYTVAGRRMQDAIELLPVEPL